MAINSHKKTIVMSIMFSAFITLPASAKNDVNGKECPPAQPKSVQSAEDQAILKSTRLEKLYGNPEVAKKIKLSSQHHFKKDNEQALSVLVDALNLPNINAYALGRIYLKQGDIYYKMGRPNETIIVFEKALTQGDHKDYQKRRIQNDLVTLKAEGKIIPQKIAIRDKDAQPLVRIPPTMPTKAKRSGHCLVTFDVDKSGQPVNIATTYCTEKKFKRPSVKSVQKWKFFPKKVGGRAAIRSSVETKVRFTLKDKCGVIIPEKGS